MTVGSMKNRDLVSTLSFKCAGYGSLRERYVSSKWVGLFFATSNILGRVVRAVVSVNGCVAMKSRRPVFRMTNLFAATWVTRTPYRGTDPHWARQKFQMPSAAPMTPQTGPTQSRKVSTASPSSVGPALPLPPAMSATAATVRAPEGTGAAGFVSPDSAAPTGPAAWLVFGLVVFACLFFAGALVAFVVMRGAS